MLSEYDGNNNLLRKYIYGPGIDQPVCMIEVADSNAVYYYHYDGLGSVVALSDSAGDTVQTYEYSVYGQVAVEDINHPNPYMFAGRRFDIEIGLYYNRARYYNPFTGRFLQADPIGYEAGLNLYAYCGNNSLNRVDPSGLWWAGDPNKDAIWMQDYATSCGPATIVNTLWNLYPDGKFPDGSAIPTEEEIRIMFEKIIYPGQTYYSGTDASIWGSQWQANTANNVGGRGVAMKEELTVLNDILSSHNTGKQYKMLIGGQWDLDDIKAGVAKGPVIHAVEWWNGSAHCSMIPKVENGGYWHVNPAWTCAVFSPDDDAVKEYFNMTFTYFNYLVDAWHVPILVPDW